MNLPAGTGQFLGMAKIIIENPGEAPKVIECPVYQLEETPPTPPE